MLDRKRRREAEEEALRIVRENARRERERVLFQDKVDRLHADEARRTQKALDWQRSPSRIVARRTGGVVKVVYYALLVILVPLSLGAVLIPHFAIKRLFFDKRG